MKEDKIVFLKNQNELITPFLQKINSFIKECSCGFSPEIRLDSLNPLLAQGDDLCIEIFPISKFNEGGIPYFYFSQNNICIDFHFLEGGKCIPLQFNLQKNNILIH